MQNVFISKIILLANLALHVISYEQSFDQLILIWQKKPLAGMGVDKYEN